jgi:hypothetical protein
MQAANQMIAEKDAFVRKTFHEIRTPCHILLQVRQTNTTAFPSLYRRVPTTVLAVVAAAMLPYTSGERSLAYGFLQHWQPCITHTVIKHFKFTLMYYDTCMCMHAGTERTRGCSAHY